MSANGYSMQVVDKYSATIDGYRPISLPVDHFETNKFGSSEEESFKLISSEAKDLIARIPEFLRTAGQCLDSNYHPHRYLHIRT